MTRRIQLLLALSLLSLSAAACADASSVTAPKSGISPKSSASGDAITDPTTCKVGYIGSEGRC